MGNTNHFEFSGKLRRLFIGVIVVGLLAAIIGYFVADPSGTRVWANFLINTMFFLGMGIMGLFFVATHTMAYGGWQTLVQRIPEAISTFIPVGVIFLAVVVAGTITNSHHLYHWADTFVMEDSISVGELRAYEADINHNDDGKHSDKSKGDEHTYYLGAEEVLAAQVGDVHDGHSEGEHSEGEHDDTDQGSHANDSNDDHAQGHNDNHDSDPLEHSSDNGSEHAALDEDTHGTDAAHGSEHGHDEHYEYFWGKVSTQGGEHKEGAHPMFATDYDGMSNDASIANPHFDELLSHKKGYLNKSFWGLRFLIYAALWIFFAMRMRSLSVRQDKEGGLALYKKHKVLSGAFMVVAGVTTSTMSWDFLMSIDAHWFSTMFGWYTTVSIWVATIATTVLILIYLKSQGYLPQVNENHLHDLGKYLFGFSIFWTYLWFSQYMLIWYANLPEETMYYHARNGDPVYRTLFYVNLGLNFFVPLGILMTRGAKRRIALMTFMASSLVFSHWLDLFLGVMPGTVGDEWAIGLLELGMLAAFGGVFLLVVFTSLSRASLIPQKHPFYLESVTHET